MALLNLNRYFESFQTVVLKIKHTTKIFSNTGDRLWDTITNVVGVVIISIALIIIGIIFALPYGLLLGEKELLGWAVTNSLPILILIAVSLFGFFISFLVAKARKSLSGKVLSILFWSCVFLGPVVWTHVANMFNPSWVEYRRVAIFVPPAVLVISIVVYGIFYNIREVLKNHKQKRLQQNAQNV